MHWFQYVSDHGLYEALEQVDRMRNLERARDRRRRSVRDRLRDEE